MSIYTCTWLQSYTIQLQYLADIYLKWNVKPSSGPLDVQRSCWSELQDAEQDVQVSGDRGIRNLLHIYIS